MAKCLRISRGFQISSYQKNAGYLFLCIGLLSFSNGFGYVNDTDESLEPVKGTDSGLYNDNFFEGDIFLDKKPGEKNAVTKPALLWPSGLIAYKIDNDIGCPDSPQCDILMKAMDHYHSKTCLRFKEWSGEESFVHVFFNKADSGACWSPVGKAGIGGQKLSLGQRCWYLGIVIHELGHAVGFWHEMNRPDRDSWIYIYWNNIIPNFGHAFAKHDTNSVNNLGESFDYKSIMMYDEYAFSKDGVSPTLQSKSGARIGPIWKKPGLSSSDIRRIYKLYGCDGNRAKDGFPFDVSCSFNDHNCGFKNGGSSAWNWRTLNETDGYLYTSYETAGKSVGYLMSVNFYDVDSNKGSLGCVRFWYLIQSEKSASLKLSQAYLEKITQQNNDPETTFELWTNATNEGQWAHVEVPLYVTRPFRLIFESQFDDNDKTATIALDDFEILYRECAGDVASSVSNNFTSSDSSTHNQMPSDSTLGFSGDTTYPNIGMKGENENDISV